MVATAAHNAEGLLLRHLQPDVSSKPERGAVVLAPWAEDGFEYEATVEEVDEERELCTLAWADGGTTCRIVPWAALAALDDFHTPLGGLWASRRSLRRALLDWQQQAEAGVAHDAYVDFAGLITDVAASELRVGAQYDWPGLHLAQTLLRRGCFTCERAYAPDPRALAALYAARAEAMRFVPGGVESKELQQLHLRAREQLHVATWKKEAIWVSFGGQLRWEILHQVLWSKALAHSAALSKVAFPLSTKSRCHHSPSHGRPVEHKEKLKAASYVAGKVSVVDPLLKLGDAQQSAGRAWRALHWAAGRDAPMTLPWTYGIDSVRRLALELPETPMHQKLLLEVAILVFAMGCRLRQSARSRRVALELLRVAVEYDIEDAAVRHAWELLSGKDLCSPAVSADVRRWRLLGYRPREELWLFQCGSPKARRVAMLPGPAPCTWVLEGVALAEVDVWWLWHSVPHQDVLQAAR
eukprot:symbB.v1.2.008267.t1/scaffold518.1/size193124/8